MENILLVYFVLLTIIFLLWYNYHNHITLYLFYINQAINHDLDIILNLNYITIKSNRKSTLDILKKKLINAKNTGDWSSVAKKYYNKLNQAQMKSPYIGILLDYLKKYL